MPFCPSCKTEYLPGIARCSDCGIALVDQLPQEAAEVYERCANCSELVTLDSEYCIHCGVIFSEKKFMCETHPTTEAVAVCIICNRLLCEQCAGKKKERTFCESHKGIETSEDWAVAFQSFDYYEANIVRGKLESAGMTVNPRNNESLGFLADGFMESVIGRSILKYPVKVFVPFDQYLEAIEIVKHEFPPDES
ncbi:MAG TPA: zinc ribbon domain-containing protein [Bacteroidota bacterium]|nr:zinc ribbon domain-containing protein [Bacteroidota bacterium]